MRTTNDPIYEEHYNQLVLLSDFEEKIDYWLEHLRPNGFDLFSYTLVKCADGSEKALTLLPDNRDPNLEKAVIRRIIAPLLNNKNFKPFEIIDDFLSVITTLENLDETKEVFSNEIRSFVTPMTKNNSQYMAKVSLGFKSFRGLLTLEEAVKRTHTVIGGRILYEDQVRDFFEGFCFGYALKFVKEQKKGKEQRTIERMKVTVSMPVFAAIIFHLGMGGVFPLVFNSKREYNASATAEYFYERFMVLKKDGTEVSKSHFKRCFKLSEMELTDANVLKALSKFPFNKIE
jgi:hypothetical protein